MCEQKHRMEGEGGGGIFFSFLHSNFCSRFVHGPYFLLVCLVLPPVALLSGFEWVMRARQQEKALLTCCCHTCVAWWVAARRRGPVRRGGLVVRVQQQAAAQYSDAASRQAGRSIHRPCRAEKKKKRKKKAETREYYYIWSLLVSWYRRASKQANATTKSEPQTNACDCCVRAAPSVPFLQAKGLGQFSAVARNTTMVNKGGAGRKTRGDLCKDARCANTHISPIKAASNRSCRDPQGYTDDEAERGECTAPASRTAQSSSLIHGRRLHQRTPFL
jgi:hypothetical protein